MSTPNAKSPPSILQLVSNEEVASSLERLIDSVVMEVTAHRSALQPQQVDETNDDALNINALPNEIIFNAEPTGSDCKVESQILIKVRQNAIERKVNME